MIAVYDNTLTLYLYTCILPSSVLCLVLYQNKILSGRMGKPLLWPHHCAIVKELVDSLFSSLFLFIPSNTVFVHKYIHNYFTTRSFSFYSAVHTYVAHIRLYMLLYPFLFYSIWYVVLPSRIETDYSIETMRSPETIRVLQPRQYENILVWSYSWWR